MTLNRVWKAACAGLVVALSGGAIAACGSSSNSTTGSSASTSAATSAASTSAAKQTTGTPIIIGDITDASYDSTESVVPAAQDAAAKYINSLGGIDGHPVQVLHCDPKGQPPATIACVNKIIAAHPLAETGISILLGAGGSAILTKEQIPFFTIPALLPELQSPYEVGLGGFNAAVPWATGQFLANNMKAKKVAELTLNLPTTKFSSSEVAKSIGGRAQYSPVYYDISLADLTAPINQVISSKPDWVILSSTTPGEIKTITALKSSGFPTDHIITGGESTDYENFIKPLGPDAQGVYQTTEFDSFDDMSNSQVATYRKEMAAAGAPARSLFAQWAFAAMMMIYQGAKHLSSPTAAGLHNYYATAGPVPIYMGPTLLPLKQAPAGLPGLRNPYENIIQWNGDKYVVVAKINGVPSH